MSSRASPADPEAAIRRMLVPRSIAILGASADASKINGKTLKALVDRGYAGAIYPVNPKHGAIGGLKCYAGLSDIAGEIDLAIVATPADQVARVLLDLGERGVRSAVVFSSGFAEIGERGAARDQELRRAIEASGVRVLGPNCLGFINAFDNVMATFSYLAGSPVPAGPIAFVSQSGAFGSSTAMLARRRGIHFGYFANTGNEADVGFVDLMSAALQDSRITVGAGYIEGLKDGDGFVRLAARALEQDKPLVVTKVGRTPDGMKAVSSHTGSLAGADAVFDCVARQFGVVRAKNEEQLLDFVEVLSRCPRPAGSRLAILTRSGGAGAMMADRANDLGLPLATFAAATIERLKEIVPEFGSLGNPVDVTAQGLYSPNLLGDSLEAILADPNVDVVAVWLAFSESTAPSTVRMFTQAKERSTKPFVVSWAGIPEDALVQLQVAGIPVLRSPDAAIESVAALVTYTQSRRDRLAERGASSEAPSPAGHPVGGERVVGTMAVAALLERHGIRMAASRFATTEGEALEAAVELGMPVALKVESPDVPHKTEVGGVRLNLRDAASVRTAFADVLASARRRAPEARIHGVVVQRMVPEAVELVVGLKRDPVFGIVIMVGLGGVFVEALRDVAFRRAPVGRAEAARMLNELKGAPLLDGFRGRPPIDRDRLAEFIGAVSRLGVAVEGIEELDLNPVVVSGGEVVALDAMLVLRS